MAGLITLREFAEEHGIKKPTVNARIKKLETSNPEKTLTIKIKNIIYLTEEGLNLLEKSFDETPVKQPKIKRRGRKKKAAKEDENELIKPYQEHIKRLEKDLDAAEEFIREQAQLIEQLMNSNSELTRTLSEGLKDSHRLLNQEQSLALIDKTESEKKPQRKKSLLARLSVAGRVLRGEYD